MNVSEFENISDASDAMISALKAFDYSAEDSLHLVDIFNSIGNNFAISTSDLASSLTKSASALVTAGVGIEQASALLTGANTIMQDPDSVSQGLKIISLRIRGVKSELQELGEDTDDILNTPKLQAKIKALTGVDIIDSTGGFRNIYDILMDIADVWNELDSMSQASVIELMAGKNRSNVFTSLMNQADTIKAAYEVAIGSSGSALAENEKYLSSIQGRIDLFTNSLQTMWMNFIDTDVVKFIVDLGTGLIKLVDAIGLIPSAVGVFAGYKIIAKDLKNLFGDTAVSAKQVRKELHQYMQQQKEAAVTSQTVANAKKAEAAATNVSAAADANETKNSAANAAANQQQANAAVKVKVHKQGEKAAVDAAAKSDANETKNSAANAAANQQQANSGTTNGATNVVGTVAGAAGTIGKTAGTITKVASAGSKVWSVVKTLGKSLGKIGLIIMAIEAATWLLGKAWDWIDEKINRVENLREEVEELKNTYEETKKTFSDNLDTLTESSDTKVYATLADEFERLTQGVDKYGNNISLTTDQYERYKEICEKIVGINPNIVKGYDSATKAIGNNAGALEKLIELQERQAKKAASDLITDENLDKVAEDAFNNANSVKKNGNTKVTDEYLKLRKVLYDSVSQELNDYLSGAGQTNATANGDRIRLILEKMGYNNTTDIVQSYWNQARGDYNFMQFMADYLDEIRNNTDKFGDEYELLLNDVIYQLDQRKDEYHNTLTEASDGLISTLLEVPYSKEGAAFDDLNNASQNLIIEWIKNAEIFKIDPNAGEDAIKSQIKENRDVIIALINNLNNETIQTMFEEMDNLDKSKLNVVEYRDKLLEYRDALWNAIGGFQNEYGFKHYNDLNLFIGLDTEEMQKKRTEAATILDKYLDGTLSDVQDSIGSLSRKQYEAFLNIDWNLHQEDINSWQGVVDIINAKLNAMENDGVKIYSTLSEEIATYNDILSQTSEIVTDNTEVTEEYKQSLIDLGISEDKLNKCFDENNKLIVRDAKALNNLVKAAKKNTAENIRLAKSQARLEYYELYKQMRPYYDAQGNLIRRSNEQVLALYEEMGALQKTIAEYSRLETQLLGTANAYDKFQAAQEADAETDYVSGIEEMVIALGEAFNTAELGTETAKASIEGIVPESVYGHLDTVDEKLAAIYSYFKEGKIAQYFSLEFDDDGAITSAEMKLGNLRKFIEDGLSNGVFAGTDWQHFEFSDVFLKELEQFDTAEEKLQYFADKFKVTRDMAFAIIESINDHDAEWLNGDYGSMFDPLISKSLEDNIYATTSALAELEAQMASGKITPEQYAEEYATLSGTLNELGQAAREDIAECEKLTAQIDEQKAKVDSLTTTINAMREKGMSWDEIKLTAEYKELLEASGVLTALSKQLEGIEITEVVIQLALDNIDAEIDEIKRTLQTKVSFGEDGEYKINVGVTLSDEEIAELEKYKKLWEERHDIEINSDPDDAKTALELIESAAQSALDVINAIDGTTITINTSSAVSNVNALYDALQNLATVSSAEIEVKQPTASSSSGGVSSKWTQKHFMMDALADGTAHASGDWGLPANEHNALMGELGPELVVDPSTSRYYTVGDTGAEMVDLKRGSIIFNHRQTAALLKNGHINSRGKAYAEGNAHVTIWPDGSSQDQWDGTGYSSWDDPTYDLNEALDDAADSVNEFEETIDWIEIRMEELDEALGKYSAQLENQATYAAKNNVIDQMIAVNKDIFANATAGAEYYAAYAEKYLAGMNDDLIAAAKNGAISITEFTKEQDEATVKAIQNYREYIQKAADLYQQAEETLTEIRDLAIQKIDNIQDYGSAKTSIEDAQTEKLQNRVDLDEEMGLITSDAYYAAMMENSGKKIEYWAPLLEQMQEEFDEAVESGKIEVGSIEWYEQLEKLYEVQAAIDEATIELEEFQNAINDLYWERFDELINRLDYLENETQGLIDLMDSADMVANPEKRKYENGTVEYWTADDVQWTDEGLASLGLYAQQMEIAEYKAKQYAEAIDDLTADYEAGLYSENEYLEKLNELKEGQYENIEAYYDAQEAIKELNETRVESIKEGIEAEISAYEELIEKKREELEAEQDLVTWGEELADQQKNIADIQRKIAALSGDNSMSAVAQRKKLQAELAEAEQELEDSYYDRSIEDRQNALDQELEDFQAEKDAEIVKWEEYLSNVEQVVADSLEVVQANASEIGDTLTEKAEEYNLTVSDAILSPWQDGALAVSDYQATFDTAMSSTMDQLEALKNKWQEVIDKMAEAGNVNIEEINQENADYAAAEKTPESTPDTSVPEQPAEQPETIKVGGKIDASGAKIYDYAGDTSGENQYFSKDPIYTVLEEKNGYLKVRHHKLSSGVTGWFRRSDVKALASGTTKLNKSGIVNIDELGEELVLRAQNGRLTYMEKGSGVIPADITSNLMSWGKLDPQDMLDRNRPAITAPHIVNNEVNITMEIGEVVHIDRVDHDTLPDLTKVVRKEMDSYMLKVNNAIKSKVR